MPSKSPKRWPSLHRGQPMAETIAQEIKPERKAKRPATAPAPDPLAAFDSLLRETPGSPPSHAFMLALTALLPERLRGDFLRDLLSIIAQMQTDAEPPENIRREI